MLRPLTFLPAASESGNDTDESATSPLPTLQQLPPQSKTELKKVKKGLNSPVRIQRGLSPSWAKVYSRKVTSDCDSEIISRTTTLDSLASKAESPRFYTPINQKQQQTFVKSLMASLKKKPKSRNFVKSGFSLGSSARERRPTSQVTQYADSLKRKIQKDLRQTRAEHIRLRRTHFLSIDFDYNRGSLSSTLTQNHSPQERKTASLFRKPKSPPNPPKSSLQTMLLKRDMYLKKNIKLQSLTERMRKVDWKLAKSSTPKMPKIQDSSSRKARNLSLNQTKASPLHLNSQFYKARPQRELNQNLEMEEKLRKSPEYGMLAPILKIYTDDEISQSDRSEERSPFSPKNLRSSFLSQDLKHREAWMNRATNN